MGVVISTWDGPQCKILTSAVVAHECFAPLTAGSGMPSGCQLDSCTAVDRGRAGNEAVSSETANGAAASAKSELVTYAYYVRTLKYYPPAIYHGQGLARYGRMGSD